MPPRVLKGVQIVKLPQWEFLGGEKLDMDGTSIALTIPSSTSVVEIRASGVAVYFQINQPGFATANSHGYLPDGGAEIIGPIFNLSSLDVYGEAGAYAHVIYFAEIAR